MALTPRYGIGPKALKVKTVGKSADNEFATTTLFIDSSVAFAVFVGYTYIVVSLPYVTELPTKLPSCINAIVTP